jgi:hypothetical protein
MVFIYSTKVFWSPVLKGLKPLSISNKTRPILYQSTEKPYDWLAIISGAKYSVVPQKLSVLPP